MSQCLIFGHMHNAIFKAFGSRKSLTLYVGVNSKMRTSLFQLLLLYAETEEERNINILIFRLVNIVNEQNARLGRDVREMACMLCAKKTIFIIEKNTTILQSMFVINKMTQWMTVGLRGNRVWNEGFCSCIPTPFSPFYPALFFIAFWNPIFCLPSTLVESLIAAKPCKCMMQIF